MIGVRDFRVKQQRVELAFLGEAMAAIGAFALVAVTAKPGGGRLDEVAVARPDAQVRRERDAKSGASGCDVDRGEPELPVRRRRDLAAERVRHQLHAVADSEHRHAGCRRRPARNAARPAPRRSSARPTG